MEKETKETPKKESEKPAEKKDRNHTKNFNQKDAKTSQHVTRYVIVGVSLAIFNFVLYSILSNLIIKNNDYLWLCAFISTAVTTMLAYILHSKITWKERAVAKSAIIKFFIWNIIITVAVNPVSTQLFSLITPLYDFLFSIFQALHILFSYEFTLTTGAFALTSLLNMIINFLFYDKFVFGKPKN